jgi:serine/threonine protein kinase
MKKFRHPNLSNLHGYSSNVNGTKQSLVHEYAANGSLAGFFSDDGNRARLSADIRLSIMFQLVRAVHFLHTGGFEGLHVCHRDITSEKIFLADDFTARLIDCGLAMFVSEERFSSIPEYACDVYSIGLVMVALILGCLDGRKSNRIGMQFDDVFCRYVKDQSERLIVNGWEKLMRDADPSIIWDTDSLELACRIAISCMAPSPDGRLNTYDLLSKLSEAICLNANIDIQTSESENAGQGGPCAVCNRNFASKGCSEGHKLCKSCIEENLVACPLWREPTFVPDQGMLTSTYPRP